MSLKLFKDMWFSPDKPDDLIEYDALCRLNYPIVHKVIKRSSTSTTVKSKYALL